MPRNAEASAKAERDRLRDRMRGMGCSVPQIAAEMARQFNLRPRLAWRYALGWPQWKLAQRHNTLHPGTKLTDARVSDHESWPHGGSPPSLRYLARLAATYGHGCTPAQLVDADDLEHLNPDDRRLLTTTIPTEEPDSPTRTTPKRRGTKAITLPAGVMLRTLGWAATAASVGYCIDLDEQARVGSVLGNPGRIDPQTIEHIDAVLWHCKRQDDALGPRGVLDTVLAQRDLVRSLLPQCPATLRPRLLSTLSNASRLAGWFSFDLNDFTSAAYYYDDARAQAHEAENIELGAVVLSGMSHLATWQGRSRIGIDHAVAARQWADQTSDMRLRAHCAAKAAKAYATDGQEEACLTALDEAEKALGSIGDQTPGYIYLYDEGLHISNCGECHLALRNGDRAADDARQSLATLDPSFTRIVALTTVDLGRAHVQSNEIDEGAQLLGDVSEIAAHNSSTRLIEILKQGRADLRPWQHTTAVRALDDRLNSHRLVLA